MTRTTGQLLAASFMDYAMPRAGHFPEFVTALSEVPSPTNRLGVRSGGEGGTTPALAVVDQRDRRCARRIRGEPYRDAGDAGARMACDPRCGGWTEDVNALVMAGLDPAICPETMPRAAA